MQVAARVFVVGDDKSFVLIKEEDFQVGGWRCEHVGTILAYQLSLV